MKKTGFIALVAALLFSACSTIVHDSRNTQEQGPVFDPGNSPTTAVEEFYISYLSYIGRDQGEFNNPLVNGAYREMDGLHPDFIQYIDYLVENGLEADPVLCAQDIPQFVEASSVKQDEAHAEVTLQDSFADHEFEASLELVDGRWLIDDIRCGD